MSAPGYKAAYGQTRTVSSVLIIFAIISMIITACNGAPVAGTTSPALTPLVETQENTPANPTTPAPMESPTPTSVPLAATVNGFEITIADFQSELALYKAALGSDLTAGDEERVLNNLVDQTLLAQAASEFWFHR